MSFVDGDWRDYKRNNMPHNKYSKKQKKLASVAPPRKKITGADFKKLKKKKK